MDKNHKNQSVTIRGGIAYTPDNPPNDNKKPTPRPPKKTPNTQPNTPDET